MTCELLDAGDDMLELIMRFVPSHDLPYAIRLSRLFRTICEPLLQASIYRQVSNMNCQVSLIFRGNNIPNRVQYLNSGSLFFSVSSIDGDGKLRTQSCAFPLPSNRAITTFSDTSDQKNIVTVAVDREQRPGEEEEVADGDLNMGAEARIYTVSSDEDKSFSMKVVPLKGSEYICGAQYSSNADRTPTIWRSRATHLVEQPDGEVWLRTLVHNASLAADKKALIAVYRLSDGEYLADKSILLSWSGGSIDNTENEEPPQVNTALMERSSSFVRDDQKRFGGVACESE